MASYTVYLHTFPNGKRYVGITSQNVKRRWRDGQGYQGQPVYNAILKYGWKNIKHDILFIELTKEDAEAKERELIKILETDSHKHGYNVEEGGDTSKLSDETKKKLSNAKKNYYKTNKHWNSGKHLSDATKSKISNSHKGKTLSEETKAKLSRRFSGSKNNMFGTKISAEHRTKLQAACIAATSKKVVCIETLVIYPSIAEASRQTGINSRSIAYAVNPKNTRYKSAGGYHWEEV